MSVPPTQEDPTDALFQLPLGEFTAARNALAAQLKKAGQGEEAARVKAIAKPSISAWAVNQVYWKHRKAFDRLIASGERFRRAQASQLAGKSADVRRPFDDRREAVSELTRLATGTLSEAGHQPTPDMTRRIASTLEALSIYGADGPAAGKLIDDVDPPGFETLAGLMPATGGAPPEGRGSRTVLPFQPSARRAAAPKPNARENDEERARREKAERAQAKAAVQAAERSLREARAAAERAESAMKKAAARVKAAEQERSEAERRLEQASAESTEARQAARRVAGEAEDAAQAVADAERALEKAKQAL